MGKKQDVKIQKIKRSAYEKQVIKDINKLNYNIRRRLVNVEKHEVTRRYPKIKESFVKLDKSVGKKTIDQLEKLRNKLRYINSLKSTSVKGMKKAKENEKKADKFYEELRRKAKIKPTDSAYKDTKSLREIIDSIYDRLLEEGAWWEKGYGSSVRQDIRDLLTDWNMSEDEIYKYMKNKLDNLYETGEDYITYEDEFKIPYDDNDEDKLD